MEDTEGIADEWSEEVDTGPFPPVAVHSKGVVAENKVLVAGGIVVVAAAVVGVMDEVVKVFGVVAVAVAVGVAAAAVKRKAMIEHLRHMIGVASEYLMQVHFQ